MLKLHPRQFAAMRAQLERDRRESLVADLIEPIAAASPRVVAAYAPAERAQVVDDVLDACAKIGVADPDTTLNWVYIRLLTNLRFHAHPAFVAVLEHPFLHPEAKGRHVVLAYFAIRKLQSRGTTAWSR